MKPLASFQATYTYDVGAGPKTQEYGMPGQSFGLDLLIADLLVLAVQTRGVAATQERCAAVIELASRRHPDGTATT